MAPSFTEMAAVRVDSTHRGGNEAFPPVVIFMCSYFHCAERGRGWQDGCQTRKCVAMQGACAARCNNGGDRVSARRVCMVRCVPVLHTPARASRGETER